MQYGSHPYGSIEYGGLFESGGGAPPEEVTLDKWFVQRIEFVRGNERRSFLATYYFSDVNDVAAPPETVTLDKYWRESSVPRFDKARNQYQYQTFFGYIEEEPSTDPSKVPDWMPKTDVPLFDKKRQQGIFPFFFTDEFHFLDAENITMDKWFVQHFNQVKRKKVRQEIYPTLFWNTDTPAAAEELTLDKWWLNANLPRWDKARQQYTYPFFDIDAAQLTRGEDVNIEKWFVQHPEQVRDKKRQQHTFPSFSIDDRHLLDAENVNLDKWFVQQPEQVWDKSRQQHTFQFYFAKERDQFLYEDSMFVVHRNTNTPRWDKTRNQFLYPFFFGAIEEEPEEDPGTLPEWWRNTNTPRWDKKRRQFQYPSFFEPRLIEFGENITLDKWLLQRPEMVHDKKRNQHLYMWTHAMDLVPPIPVEPFDPADSLAKWFVQRPEQVWDKKRLQYLYPNSFFYNTFPEFFPILYVSSGAVSFVRKVLYQAYAESPAFPHLIMPDKWKGYPPDIIFDKERLQYLYPNWFAETDMSDEIPPFARGFHRGVNRYTNTGFGTRNNVILGRNNDTNTPVGTRKGAKKGRNNDTNTPVGKRLD